MKRLGLIDVLLLMALVFFSFVAGSHSAVADFMHRLLMRPSPAEFERRF